MTGMRSMAAALFLLTASGCVAQQADLVNVEKTLNARIAKLDKQEQELQHAIKQAKSDFEKIVGETRARLNQDITVLRDADLPSVHGGIEQATHQVTILRNRVDDLEHQSKAGLDGVGKRLGSLEKAQAEEAVAARADREKIAARLDAMGGTLATMAKTLGAKLDEHDKTLARPDADSVKSAQRLDAQERALTEQLAAYGKALGDFKKALATLGDKLVQDEQRVAEMATKVQGRGESTAKIDGDLKALATHLNEVTKSVSTVAKALETVGGQLDARIDDQDKRLADMTKSLQALDGQISTLTQTLSQQREGAPRGTAAPAPPAESSINTEPSPSRAADKIPEIVPRADAAMLPLRETAVKEVYEQHLGRFRRGDMDGALQGFREFLAQYPTSELAPNAQFWLGECYYTKRDFARAIEAYDRVKLINPSSDKVPAALLKKGFAYLALKDPNRASSVWRQIVDGYPRTPEAGKAQEKLAQLKQIR